MSYETQDFSCVKAWRIAAIMRREEGRLTLVARDYASDQYADSITAWHWIATKAGVHRVTLFNILNGRQDDVMLDTAERIVRACGLDWPVEIDQDLEVVPRRGWRCARRMAEENHDYFPEWTMDELTDHYVALRAANKEPHDHHPHNGAVA